MHTISTSDAPAAVGPYSQAVAAGQLVFVSGQIPVDPVTGGIPSGIEAQTEQALANLRAILAAGGVGIDRVTKVTLFLADIADFPVVNKVYARFFAEPYPARSCVAVSALPKGVLLEVDAIAVTP
ncbi:MAG: RidA family protein [Kiritimatiellae bacterium]|nr:RidA family protein [Kiritimatiellia bacterium]MBP5225794.1 RidA family protein [Kiritimatiellia bacterium]